MNKIEELLKLKELLDSGLINESDFNRKKDELFKNRVEDISKPEIQVSSKEVIENKEIISQPFTPKNNNKYYYIVTAVIIILIVWVIFFNRNTDTQTPIKNDDKIMEVKLPPKEKIQTNLNQTSNTSISKIRNDIQTEKTLFFEEKIKKETAYKLTLKKDTIILDLHYRLKAGQESNYGSPDQDGFYSRYADYKIIKNGKICDFDTYENDDVFIIENNILRVKNFETKTYVDYILNPTKSNCGINDILQH